MNFLFFLRMIGPNRRFRQNRQKIAAIVENYQQEDGTIIIPEVLRKYTGFDRV